MDYQHIGQYNSLVFKDYCFSTTWDYFREVSPDGRIAVFANPENETTLMSLKTGQLARLPSWEFIGWMPVDQ
jgi:hypothetical protein